MCILAIIVTIARGPIESVLLLPFSFFLGNKIRTQKRDCVIDTYNPKVRYRCLHRTFKRRATSALTVTERDTMPTV